MLRVLLRKVFLVTVLLLFAVGCVSISQAPKDINVDGKSYLACRGFITVSSESMGKQSVSFTGPDNTSEEIHGATRIEISSVAVKGNDLRRLCDSKFAAEQADLENKAVEEARKQGNGRRWQELREIEKEVCGDKSIVLYNDGSEDITTSGTISCAAEGFNGPLVQTSYISAGGCSVLQSKFPQYTCHSAPASLDFRRSQPRRQAQRLRATYATELTTTEYGSLKCGDVARDEIVTLLVDDGSFVKVRTANGATGWAGAGWFDVVK